MIDAFESGADRRPPPRASTAEPAGDPPASTAAARARVARLDRADRADRAALACAPRLDRVDRVALAWAACRAPLALALALLALARLGAARCAELWYAPLMGAAAASLPSGGAPVAGGVVFFPLLRAAGVAPRSRVAFAACTQALGVGAFTPLNWLARGIAKQHNRKSLQFLKNDPEAQRRLRPKVPESRITPLHAAMCAVHRARAAR